MGRGWGRIGKLAVVLWPVGWFSARWFVLLLGVFSVVGSQRGPGYKHDWIGDDLGP